MTTADRIISVVTPVCRVATRFLSEAYESLRSQDMPEGWRWQWVVQADGDAGPLPALIPQDRRISAGSGRPGGVAVTRNLCLARATGELVKVLDADDQLMPGALAREIRVLSARPEIGWTTACALDLHDDGRVARFGGNPGEGPIEQGEILRYWRSHGYQTHVHPATLCIRRDLLLSLGGWMALPASEDTGLLIAASMLAPGYFIGSPGLLYRKWPGQMTAQPMHADPVERPARMAVIELRAVALAALWGQRLADSRTEAREQRGGGDGDEPH